MTTEEAIVVHGGVVGNNCKSLSSESLSSSKESSINFVFIRRQLVLALSGLWTTCASGCKQIETNKKLHSFVCDNLSCSTNDKSVSKQVSCWVR